MWHSIYSTVLPSQMPCSIISRAYPNIYAPSNVGKLVRAGYGRLPHVVLDTNTTVVRHRVSCCYSQSRLRMSISGEPVHIACTFFVHIACTFFAFAATLSESIEEEKRRFPAEPASHRLPTGKPARSTSPTGGPGALCQVPAARCNGERASGVDSPTSACDD